MPDIESTYVHTVTPQEVIERNAKSAFEIFCRSTADVPQAGIAPSNPDDPTGGHS